MDRLLTGLADNWPEESALGRLCAAWPGENLGPTGASLPLRIAGGLHALVLSDRDAALAAVYPPNEVSNVQLIETVLAAFERHRDFFRDWMQNAPQTNEVRRSAALIAAAQSSDYPMELRMQTGYDHSYYFIASFIDDHLRYHAHHLRSV